MHVEIDASGPIASIEKAIDALNHQKDGPLGAAWKVVGEKSLEFAGKKFDQNSGGGGDWVALAPSTVKAKGHSKILIETRKLRKSLDKGGAGQVMRPTETGIESGTADPKAKFHQEGGVNLPRRVVLPKLTSDVRSAGLRTISEATLRIIKPAADAAAPQVA